MLLEKTLESPFGPQGDQTSQYLEEINPEYTLEGPMLKLKLQYISYLMQRTESLEKPLMLERLRAGGEGDGKG